MFIKFFFSIILNTESKLLPTLSIFEAIAMSLAFSTLASPAIRELSALLWASALAWPVDSTAALRAWISKKSNISDR